MAYLPPEQAQVGTELAVEYLNERYPVTVAVAGCNADLRPGERTDPVVNILVCAKRVPMTGGTIVLTDDEQSIETRPSASRSARTRSAAWKRRCG